MNAGNVGAVKEFRKLLERNDQMEAARSFDRPAPSPVKAKAEKLGKKEAARLAAEKAGADSEWGSDLMFSGSRRFDRLMVDGLPGLGRPHRRAAHAGARPAAFRG